ncbi:MAG TPA: IMS domain-containing protein [Coleofasciculaceae cyanobacterium]|jgi:curved DNA-binding protein CbpA
MNLLVAGMGIVRIPLDYYRILGLPIQATAEQLQQAHRDRTQQLPRREFSEAALASRRQLIDAAYEVLSDPEARQDYDAQFLAKSYELLDVRGVEPDSEALSYGRMASDPELSVDPHTPSIEITDSQFIGALVVLFELGEYELVLRLGRPYLSGGNLNLRAGEFGDPEIVSADIVLTVALACLELGREQWQQGQYENAAESLETGQQLLLREGIFASLRGEMRSDLYKLRPYRILELLAMPGNREETRRQGMSLLEDMLHDRGGIDGSEDDYSGLGVDDFLRFIQQLRSYLTAAEQQALFEAEAQRPSAVASYLAVYALLARGFAERQPSLIRRAKLVLLRLGTKQDVHLEQAVCALLLGQTDEASRALGLSQEFDSLTFIREHSQGSPDLLPGLCLYSERWLQNEVFPHFRDLSRKQPSLKEYFADEDVQAYLEELPNEPEPSSSWGRSPTLTRQPPRRDPESSYAPQMRPSETIRVSSGDTATVAAPSHANNGTSLSPEPVFSSPVTSNGYRAPIGLEDDVPATRVVQPDVQPPRRSQGAPRLDRLLFLAALGVLGLLLLGFLGSRVFGGRSQTATASPAKAEQGFSQITQQGQPAVAASPTLTTDEAKAVIESWLAAKAAAMGETHDLTQLDKVLAEPILSQWKGDAEQVKAANSYLEYEHSNLEITSVETDADSAAEDSAEPATEEATPETAAEDPAASPSDTAESPSPDAVVEATRATVEATVTESIQPYTNGQPDGSSSSPDNLRVRYSLTRQDGQWLIESIEAI